VTKNEILIDLAESDKTEFGKEDFATQSEPQKVFSSIWAVESEVNSGEFSQYYLNDSAETAGFVVEALNAIGAVRTADICSRAIVCAFPNGLPATADAISAIAAAFSPETLEKLESLGGEFYTCPHDLTDLLFTFVSGQPQEFGPLAQPG